METYTEVLNYAVPCFVILIFIEAIAANRMGLKVNRGADMITSFSSGITNVIREVLGLTVVIVSYAWIVDKVAIFEVQSTWLVYLIGFIGLDFAGYWVHRLKHNVNFIWIQHIIHHSSEEFNLSVGFRTPVSLFFSFFNLFLIPAAIFGVPAQVIAVIAPLHFFAQFWYHTRLIKNMGWLEHIIITPSHHRVHHAINDIYLNRNYGQVFVLWDKWFGTFQPELEEVSPVYGNKRPVKTWNPFIINFIHAWRLFKDAWRTSNHLDKFRIWLMPIGWRPSDMIEKYPLPPVTEVYHMEKYDSNPSRPLLTWSWIQLIITIGLMFFLFNRLAEIGFPEIFVYGAFIFASIFSYSALLDKVYYSLPANIVRTGFGLTLIWWQGGWFGMETMVPGSTFLMIFFLIGTLVIDGYFYFAEILTTPSIASSLHLQKR